jgi:diadenosine tetraphosphate (Ap4A) HIT family hydrolase
MSLAVQFLTKFLQKEHGTDSATVCIQEGQGAGQTINHLHVHIIPRKPGDFKHNDDIYPILEAFDDEYYYLTNTIV